MILLALALAAAGAADQVQAAPAEGARGHATTIMSQDPGTRHDQEEWGYADAIVAGDMVFVSGVVAGLRPGESGYEAAYIRAFDEIGARLRRVGASWGDVVEISSFHTDLVSQMPAMVAVKRRYVGPPYPAWTAIGVTRLIPGSGITEIRVIAMRDRRPRR
jgi:enamine deaminase RidA (YjgF/YER057c/UK114 family)